MASNTPTDHRSHRIDRRAWIKHAAAAAGTTAVAATIPGCASPSPGVSTSSAPSGPLLVSHDDGPVAETTVGRVRGFIRNGIHTFKGMPYAAGVAGANRFKMPEKPEPWPGVRSSMAIGNACPQAFHIPEGRRGGWSNDEEAFMFEWDDGRPGEDCLSVNVWTPGTDNGRRPVLVWIHGGGYSSGSSNELRMYDGESLARRGNVVVVSLNHRIGVLGYLSLLDYGPDWVHSPNVGQLDIVAALEWVRDNIATFGGDPNRVALFGQSGGGLKIGTLMGMPAAQGLYQRAIIQSGSGLRQRTPEDGGALARAVLDELGLSRASIDRLREIPVLAIVRAGLDGLRKANANRPAGAGSLGWGPVVDGTLIPRDTWDPAAPDFSTDVPLLVGTVLNEFTNSIQRGDPGLDTMTLETAIARLTEQQGAAGASRIIELYQRKFPGITPYTIVSRVGGLGARRNAITQASLKTAQGGAPAYLYRFDWQTPVLDGRPRAYHCADLPFCFHNTDRCAAMTGGGDEARTLAGRMADAWVAFAASGDPNHAGLPAWPAFTDADVPTMIFDDACVVAGNPDGDERALL